MKAELIWAAPEKVLSKIARVSNPKNENNDKTAPRLIRYLMRNKHWSPFEMVNACLYIECPRDISRQILRHRSFTFQEFSGRYAEYDTLEEGRELRLRDVQNRQNSLLTEDKELQRRWEGLVEVVRTTCITAYRTAISLGVAPEVARVLLPEGLVPTRLYMNGSLRSWLHYIEIRTDPSTQKEHREVAEMIKSIIWEVFPETAKAYEDAA